MMDNFPLTKEEKEDRTRGTFTAVAIILVIMIIIVAGINGGIVAVSRFLDSKNETNKTPSCAMCCIYPNASCNPECCKKIT